MKEIASRLMAILLFFAVLLSSSVSAQTNSTTIANAEREVIETSETLGVRYHTHVQNIGWESEWAKNGEQSGTQGLGLRLEGIEIQLTGNVPEGAAIEYRTHVENIGWENFWSINGKAAGTEGLGLRLEGIQIQLVNLPNYSVEYRTHVQNIGWETTWAKDGEDAGTQGLGLRLEGIEIRLIKQGPSVVTDLTESSEISDAGGSVSLTDGAEVLVPAGALSENSTFDFTRLLEEGGSDSFYHLEGIPSFWQEPMEITLPLKEMPENPEDTYVAVYYDENYRPSSDQAGINRQLFKAEVADGMATIQLPSLNPDIITVLSEDEKLKTNVSPSDLFMYLFTDIPRETVGHFRLSIPSAVRKNNPALVNEIKNILTETSAYIESTAGLNLSYADGRNPLPVDIFDFNSVVERYLGSRNPNAWGYLEVAGISRSSEISYAWISINSHKFKDPDAARQIRATVAHELFHYYQQLYLTNDGRSQGLLQEASAVWMEFQMMKKYPDFWPKVLDPENVGWFTKNGLLRPQKTACHNEDAHAYASSLFLQYMSDKNGDKAIGNLWKSIRTHDELFKALADGFGDPNWYMKWPDFAKNLFSGDYTKAMPDSTWSIHNNAMYDPGKRYTVDDPYTQMKHQINTNVYALSAQTHPITLRYGTKNFNAGEKADLKITNQSSEDITAFLYRKKGDDAELIATLDSNTPFILKDLPKEGQQNLSLVTASKWQPTMIGMDQTKNIVVDVEIVFDTTPPDNYDCGWQPDYSKLVKKMIDPSFLYKYGYYHYDTAGRYHGLSRIYLDPEMTKPYLATPYYEGQMHGIVTSWYDNGNMKIREEYQHGLLDGSYKKWWENGQLEEESTYSNNVFNGVYRYWWKDGAKLVEGTYVDGKKEGTWTHWHANGNKSRIYTYVNDEWNGPSTTWHENGVKESEGNYLDGHRVGTWTWWNPDGTLRD